VLYTRGTVDFYKTYPGMYVPAPLKITVYDQDSSLESLCDEILGLTKMNWNNTHMDGRLPITPRWASVAKEPCDRRCPPKVEATRSNRVRRAIALDGSESSSSSEQTQS
jgi:hypothetical protein